MKASELVELLGQGYVLAASPQACELYDWNGHASGICIEPGHCRALIQKCGHLLKWLPMHSWYDNGVMGWTQLFPAERVAELRRLGFDFFTLTQ